MKSTITIIILILAQLYSIHTQCISFRNTIYKLSGTNCGQRCADRGIKNPNCSQNIYSPGCFCKPGYYRDSTWNCVPGQQCDALLSGGSNDKSSGTSAPSVKPQDCPPNQLFSECGNYCTEKCRNTNEKYCPQNICDVGCFCIDGYFRGDDGICIPQLKCGVKLKEKNGAPPVVCPFGEHYEKCELRCKETCNVRFLGCKGDNAKCEPGCFCKTGYGRNINGDCVPRKDCKKAGVCKRHEEFKFCGNSCAESCDPPDECPDKCKPGCFCKPGYLRNPKRKCVSDGSKIKTRLVTKLTDRYDGVFKCQKLDKGKTSDAQVRARSGPVKCGKNQVNKKCGTRCGESCDSLKKDIVCPLRKTCISGCFCEKGFYRNSKNKCVSADKCKSNKSSKKMDKIRKKLKKSCQETEEYRECGNHCIELCSPPTVCPKECEFGCFCKEGLLRTSDGNCVPEKSCPPLPKPPPKPRELVKCGKGEKYFDCKKECIQNCVELKDQNVCPIRQKCLFGCLCIKSYYRDASGECVIEKACSLSNGPPVPRSLRKKNRKPTNIPDCNKNEEYLTCGNYCIELCKPPKKCTQKCQSGCFCKAKYFRNARGNCVRESKCEGNRIMHKIKLKIKDKCTKANEELKDCGYNCGQTCVEQAKHIVCPKRMACTPGCFCKPGTYRKKDGDCVPIKDCKPKVRKYRPKTTTPKPKPPIPECNENESYDDCGDHCIELCKPPDSCESSCESGCFCESGFYRPKPDGPCVPEEKCPKEPENQKFKMKIKLKCEENEIYSECGTRCGQMCVDLFKSVICPKKGLCVGGCFCEPGYFRNERGKCVLESQCPDTRPKPDKPLSCDENEEFKECGDRCKQSCETYLKKSECPKKKCGSGCFCNEGFYKDQYGNCVDPKDCTDPSIPTMKPESCGENEKLVTCGNRCGQTCEELTQNVTCASMRACVSGCFCEKGFRRNDNGLCVPEGDCYTSKTRIKFEIRCEENEKYSKCEVRCGQSCDDLGRKVDCPKSRQCASGCFCTEGLYRNENGDCIPEGECPDVGPPDQIPKKLDCGPNEEYNECGTRCGQACEDLGRRVICPKRRICISGCFCNQGYFRNYAGECVPMLDCPDISPPKRPPPSCDANEEFNDCGKRCGQSCDEWKNSKQCPKRQICVSGCFCESDYRRDHNGECVTEDTCPARDRDELNPESVKCGKNEDYNECGSRCGQGCEDLLNGQTDCPKGRTCVSGCFCSEGFYRNEIGECVSERECPSPPIDSKPKDCGENERYTDCGSQCGQACEGKLAICPRKRMCIAGCFCKKGFYRDKYDSCVPLRLCFAKDKGGGRKKPKSTTETPEEEDQESTEDVTDGTEDTHSEDQTDESSSDGTEEEDSTESTEDDTTEHTTKGSGVESTENSDSDEGTDESPTEKSNKPIKKKGADNGPEENPEETNDKPNEEPEEGSTEGSKKSKNESPEEDSDTEGSDKESTGESTEESTEKSTEESTESTEEESNSTTPEGEDKESESTTEESTTAEEVVE